jgi:hypothetical protein
MNRRRGAMNQKELLICLKKIRAAWGTRRLEEDRDAWRS